MYLTREQTNAIIKNGQANGLTGQAVLDSLVRNGYQVEGIEAPKLTVPKQETFLDQFAKPGERIIEGIKQKGEQVAEALTDESRSTVGKITGAGAALASSISSTAYNALPDTARNLLDQAGAKIGEGFEKVTDKISELPAYKEYAKMANSNPNDPFVRNFEESLKVLSDAGVIAGETLAVKGGIGALEKLNNYNKLINARIAGNNPKLAEELIRHANSAKQVLQQDPTIANDPQKFNRLLDRIKENTQLQFRTEGLVELADDIVKIDSSKINSVAQMTDEISKVISSPSTRQILAGATRSVTKPFTELVKDVKGTIKVNTPASLLRKAKMQGFAEPEVKFVQSMEKLDKAKAFKMQELAERAVTDKRVTQRPIDLVGETFIEKIKPIETLNQQAGKQVDIVAKSLKGKMVDAKPLSEKAFELVDELESFKYTPELSKRVEQFIQGIPEGTVDAYELHVFKKAIDELVNYGVAGEGLKGKAQSILKGLRKEADDILDKNFEAYNKANTDYRNTVNVLNDAKDLFGKKNGFSSEKGGQLMRSVFSNNAQRGRVIQLLEDIEKLSKKYNIKVDQNLIDQALFAIMLEDIYGTQAVTSFRGQIEKAVSGVQKITEGLRNPVKGVGEALATGTEAILGISEEGKKAILKELLSQ